MMMVKRSRRTAAGLVLLASGVVSLGATEGPLGAGTAAAAATPSCTAPVDTWPVSQRLEQLLMVGGQFANLGASTSQAAAGVGGFVFFGQPAAGSGPAIRSGLAALDSAAAQGGQIAPWMSTDEEGGPIARLSNVIGALPSPRQMAAQWTPAQVQSVLSSHASAMRSLGMTMDLAPVVDTANANDTVAGENYRSFSENGQVAASYGLAYANGLRAGGIVPVAKHFPGLGHASADTDTAPAVDPPLSQLQTDDLIPFEKAAAAGLPVIMVGHPLVPGLTGGLPASLSPSTYQLLRGQLSFGGVTMTDDLDAVAISAAGYTQSAAAVKAVEAGADMVMIDSSEWSPTVSALSQAVSSGALSLGQLDASVTRILRAKGITVCSGVTYAPGTNGSLQELFTVATNNQVYVDYENPGGAWSGWHPFPGPATYGPVTDAPGTNGSLQELFTVATNNQVYVDYENPGGAWSGWHPFPGPATYGPVTDAPGTNGSLQELFTVATNNQVYVDYENPGGAWSGWHPFPGPATYGPITDAPGTNGSLQELFTVATNNQVYVDYENPGGAWSGWHPFPGPATYGPITDAPGTNGSLQELFTVATNNQVYVDYENPGGAWSGWHPFPGPATYGPITDAPGTNGSLQELFTVATNNQVYVDYENPGGAWSGWHPFPGPATYGPITDAPGTNGSLQELFTVATNNQVYVDYENPGGAWSGWHPFGAP